jgi:asparagine N-glycosylation enzyme membrane subunit Stt3
VVAIVQEMQPVYRSGSRTGLMSVFPALGGVWIPALPALLWLLWRPWRPAARLLALWTIVMALGTLRQVRMSIYFLPVASILAGAACAWLVHRAPANRRRIVAAALAVLILAVNLPFAIPQVASDRGINPDWVQAFTWLRTNTPDPLPAGSWGRYFPAKEAAGAWGVAIWWDYGYELEQVAHRIPMSNGTQSGAIEMARFYVETIPEAAVAWLRQTGARYVTVDPLGPLFAGQNHSRFPAQVNLLGRQLDTYYQTLYERDEDGNFLPVPVYLPTYYQTMIARLYLADGAAVAGANPWVFETAATTAPNGKTVELIVSKHQFSTQNEVASFVGERPSARLIVGCLDPSTSCVPLPAVKGLKRVFTSDPLPLSRDRLVRAVKIYEVVPE